MHVLVGQLRPQLLVPGERIGDLHLRRRAGTAERALDAVGLRQDDDEVVDAIEAALDALAVGQA